MAIYYEFWAKYTSTKQNLQHLGVLSINNLFKNTKKLQTRLLI